MSHRLVAYTRPIMLTSMTMMKQQAKFTNKIIKVREVTSSKDHLSHKGRISQTTNHLEVEGSREYFQY